MRATLAIACGFLIVVCALGLWAWPYRPIAQVHAPTCYTFHRGVVIVPTICGKHDVCETAIEAKVCDSILIPRAKK